MDMTGPAHNDKEATLRPYRYLLVLRGHRRRRNNGTASSPAFHGGAGSISKARKELSVFLGCVLARSYRRCIRRRLPLAHPADIGHRTWAFIGFTLVEYG